MLTGACGGVNVAVVGRQDCCSTPHPPSLHYLKLVRKGGMDPYSSPNIQ